MISNLLINTYLDKIIPTLSNNNDIDIIYWLSRICSNEIDNYVSKFEYSKDEKNSDDVITFYNIKYVDKIVGRCSEYNHYYFNLLEICPFYFKKYNLFFNNVEKCLIKTLKYRTKQNNIRLYQEKYEVWI